MKRLDYTIEDIKKYCFSKGGECLEEQYKGNRYKYKCICDQKHIFFLNWYTATRISSWCPICKRVMLIADDEIKKIHNYCRSKNGSCLEEEYKGTNKRYKTICAKGHIFYLKWSIAKGNGTTWCSVCAGRVSPKEGIADINKFCKSKKGYCLDQEYKGTHHKYNCICHLGHEFKIFWKDSKKKETWCPWCYTYFVISI